MAAVAPLTSDVGGQDAVLAANVGDTALLCGGTLEVVDAGGSTPHLLLLAAHAHQGAAALQGTLPRLLKLVDGGAADAIFLTCWETSWEVRSQVI